MNALATHREATFCPMAKIAYPRRKAAQSTIMDFFRPIISATEFATKAETRCDSTQVRAAKRRGMSESQVRICKMRLQIQSPSSSVTTKSLGHVVSLRAKFSSAERRGTVMEAVDSEAPCRNVTRLTTAMITYCRRVDVQKPLCGKPFEPYSAQSCWVRKLTPGTDAGGG